MMKTTTKWLKTRMNKMHMKTLLNVGIDMEDYTTGSPAKTPFVSHTLHYYFYFYYWLQAILDFSTDNPT